MLGCTETVTFIRPVREPEGDRYETAVIGGVSWFDRTRVKPEGAGMAYDNGVRLRIPAERLGTFFPAVGDYVVRGTVEGSIGSRRDLEIYRPRRVASVRDDRRGGLPHAAVEGV